MYRETRRADIIALDAATGRPATEFGSAGTVDLTKGIVVKDASDYKGTSPPAIAGSAARAAGSWGWASGGQARLAGLRTQIDGVSRSIRRAFRQVTSRAECHARPRRWMRGDSNRLGRV
jgi:hypothetical protein